MPRSAVVVVLDRLGAGLVGPYGNSWLPTPGWARLAAESLLVEFAVTDSPRLGEVYRSYWEGTHAAGRVASSDATRVPLLPDLCAQAGIATQLLTDEVHLVGCDGVAAFEKLERLEAPGDAGTAARAEETQLGNLFFTASERLAEIRRPTLLWIHSRGLAGPWDAPLDLRNALADDEDPTPPEFTAPPGLVLPENPDPDELLGIQQAAGGQAMVVDMALDVLLDACDASSMAHDALLVVTGLRGYPLGEHGAVGEAAPGLYEELLHVPLLVRWPDRTAAAVRTQQFVQPSDLFATLQDWLELPRSEPRRWGRSLLPIGREDAPLAPPLAAAADGEEKILRTPAWHLRQTPPRGGGQGEAGRELYVKPDDRWEVNDVADRVPQIADAMAATLARFEAAAAARDAAQLLDLPEEILAPPE